MMRIIQNDPAAGKRGCAMKNRKQLILTALAVMAAGIFLCWLFFFPDSRGAVFSALGTALTPFAIGGGLAFVLNLLLRPLERLWACVLEQKRKSPRLLRRGVCLLLSVLALVGLVLAVVLIVVPEVVRTLQMALDALRDSSERIRGWWQTLRTQLAAWNIALPSFDELLRYLTTALGAVFGQKGLLFVGETVRLTTSVVGVLADLLVGLVLALYILACKESLARRGKMLLRAGLPERACARLLELLRLVERTFSSFMTGQLTEAVIIGALCCVGMLLLRLPYAGAVSVLVGFTALIPVFGALIGTVVGAFLILLVSPVKAIWFVIFILVLQQLEGNLIYPRVVGKSVGLPPFWTFAAVTVGGSAFGVVGMLVGVPMMSVLYTLIGLWTNARLRKKEQMQSTGEAGT